MIESQVWIAYPKVGLEKQAALRRTIGLDYQHPDLESYYKLCTFITSLNASHYEIWIQVSIEKCENSAVLGNILSFFSGKSAAGCERTMTDPPACLLK
jgi:hypothetical protein